MFSGFLIDWDKEIWFGRDFEGYGDIGRRHLIENRQEFRKNIDEYRRGKTISAQKIALDWFPLIDVDVFISHARRDKMAAEILVGWLYDNFGLKCFIDSNVWNNVKDLVNLLRRTMRPVGISPCPYDTESQIYGHAYMILAVSLMKMIDRAEAVFLINAGHAMPKSRITYSPWIYSEITCTNLIRKRPLLAYRKPAGRMIEREADDMQLLLEHFTISYDVNLDNLERLDYQQIEDWNEKVKTSVYEHPLDALYEITKYRNALKQTQQLIDSHPDRAKEIYGMWNCESLYEEIVNEGIMTMKPNSALRMVENYLRACRGGTCPLCYGNIWRDVK